jgi:methionine synthase II (cobalamin-independent)
MLVEIRPTFRLQGERALAVLPPERILVTPDCGLRHVPADAARAMTTAAAVRGRLHEEKKDT